MALRALSRKYKSFLNDIWSSGIDAPITLQPDAPAGEFPVATVYSQTLTLGVASFYDDRTAYVSSWYASIAGLTPVGSSTGDKMCIQVVSHGAIALNRFSASFNVPVKSFKANGLLIDEVFLEQVQGFFNFVVDSIAGYEALYDLPEGAIVTLTEITPYGEGN